MRPKHPNDRPKSRKSCPDCGGPVRRTASRQWTCGGCGAFWYMDQGGSPDWEHPMVMAHVDDWGDGDGWHTWMMAPVPKKAA